ARQQAVDELRSTIDFREDLSILAAETEVSRTGALAAWAQAAPAGLTRAIGAVFAACSLVTIVIAVLAFEDWIDSQWLAIWLGVELAIAWSWRGGVKLALSRIATADRELALGAAPLPPLASD